jgi:hypothetical protein
MVVQKNLKTPLKLQRRPILLVGLTLPNNDGFISTMMCVSVRLCKDKESVPLPLVPYYTDLGVIFPAKGIYSLYL